MRQYISNRLSIPLPALSYHSTLQSERHHILDSPTPEDLRVLAEVEDELARCGSFQRVFPCPGAIKYRKFFEREVRWSTCRHVSTQGTSLMCCQDPPLFVILLSWCGCTTSQFKVPSPIPSHILFMPLCQHWLLISTCIFHVHV